MACVVLASGLSERFGKTDKLCAELGGRPILSHVLDTAAELQFGDCLLYTSPSPRDRTRSRMPSSA